MHLYRDKKKTPLGVFFFCIILENNSTKKQPSFPQMAYLCGIDYKPPTP